MLYENYTLLEVLMNDAFILSDCFLDSLSPPLFGNRRDRAPRPVSPPANCGRTFGE